jgi:hypothetical protein
MLGVGTEPHAGPRESVQSGLQTHIAATEGATLCTQMKSWQRFLNSNQRFGVSENCLDKLARFFPNSPSLNGCESGEGLSPAGFFALFHTFDRRINMAGKKGEAVFKFMLKRQPMQRRLELLAG